MIAARLAVGGCLLTLAACGSSTEDRVAASPSAPTSISPKSSTSSVAPHYDGRTSCRQVMYVGESTSVGMVSPLQIPVESERLEARLQAVGVRKLTVNVSGGRMTIGRLDDRPNTMDVLTPELVASVHGCFMMAIGVNDAAAAAALHDPSQIRTRIDMVLKRIGDKPVLWPLVRTSSAAPQFYDEVAMQAWDKGLREATKRYPKLRLYDYPAEMDPQWVEGDGVHDRRIGSRSRALMYARALTVAFPAQLPMNSSTVIGSKWGMSAGPSNRPVLTSDPHDRQAYWSADAAALRLYVSGKEWVK